MKIDQTVHTALDELRMQMLGAQVLFGFQFQGIFQDGFKSLSFDSQIADLAVFGLLVLTIAFLIAPAAQHRLVERGNATRRIFGVAKRFAGLALGTYTAAVGLDVVVVTSAYWGTTYSMIAGGAAVLAAITLWFGLGIVFRTNDRRTEIMADKEPELHEKIDQMLTESRVILPGAQALLGFQFVVTMTKAFEEIPPSLQTVHFCGLAAVLVAVMILIAPAAVHRLAFHGQDAKRMHDIGSVLITIALIPLAAGIAADVYVAFAKVLHARAIPLLAGMSTFLLLGVLWYGLPLMIRARRRTP